MTERHKADDREAIMGFLQEIADGKILLTPRRDPGRVYGGNVWYDASNGWGVVLFNDCNEWDYIDSVIVDGKRTNTDFLWEDEPPPRDDVSEEDAWRIWRIPGYLTWRCHGCGEVIEKEQNVAREGSDDWYRCADCPPEKIDKGAHAPMPKQWRLCDDAERIRKQPL